MMEIRVITTEIEVQTLSVDSIPALLETAARFIRMEIVAGKIAMSDGDCIEWGIEISNNVSIKGKPG